MRTSKRSTLQSKIIYHRILYRILTQHFYNNNFSTAVGYVSTKMGREDIRDVKKPYATTTIYNPGAQLPVVPLYTNPLQIGKLLPVAAVA